MFILQHFALFLLLLKKTINSIIIQEPCNPKVDCRIAAKKDILPQKYLHLNDFIVKNVI